MVEESVNATHPQSTKADKLLKNANEIPCNLRKTYCYALSKLILSGRPYMYILFI